MSDPDNDSENRARKDAVAVALKHGFGSEKAPKVVAAGRGLVAEQILEIAFANGIKVREDADLAEILSAIDIGSEIPLEVFAAIAEILVYVYRENGKLSTGPAVNEESQNPFSGFREQDDNDR